MYTEGLEEKICNMYKSMLFHDRVIKESPRWLISQGRTDEAMKILHQWAQVNGKKIPANVTIVTTVNITIYTMNKKICGSGAEKAVILRSGSGTSLMRL